MIDGDEMDALTRWKRYLHWAPGERKRIKRQYNKRQRRELQRRAERELERALCDEWIDLDIATHREAVDAERWYSCREEWYWPELPEGGDGWSWGCGALDVNSRMITRLCGDWRYK